MTMTGTSYQPPRFFFNRHIETIFPSVMRSVTITVPLHERIPTPDDDFLDLDLYKQESSKCVIISHGLEGNSTRAYVTGMAKAFLSAGYDVITWNYRGCGEEMNRQRRFYHSGATDDLQTVISHVEKNYNSIVLLGFSLGGNLTLKYLGEPHVHHKITNGIAVSAPIDLYGSCLEICKPHNWIYHQLFLTSLSKKVRAKAAIRTDLDVSGLKKIRTLMEFDDAFTGPIHGYRNAIEYYTDCSAVYYLDKIQVPTLILTADNDPFLSRKCYPEVAFNKNLTALYPERGGHVGFTLFNKKGLYWSEIKALEFIESNK